MKFKLKMLGIRNLKMRKIFIFSIIILSFFILLLGFSGRIVYFFETPLLLTSLLSFFLFCVMLIWNGKILGELIKKINKKYLILLIIIFLLGLSLRFIFSPFTHILSPEYEYMEIAKNIAEKNPISVSRLSGYPLLLSIPFSLFGFGNSIAFYTNIIISVLLVLVIFFLSYALFEKAEVAIYSSLLAAISPFLLLFSGLSDAELISGLFIAITLFSFILYFKVNNKKLLFLGIFSLAFSLHLKSENLLLLFVVPTILFFKMEWKKKIKDFYFYIPWIILFFLLIPVVTSIFLGYNNNYNHSKFILETGLLDVKTFYRDVVKLKEIFFGSLKLNLVTLIAAVGILSFFKKRFRNILIPALWFISYLSLYVLLKGVCLSKELLLNIYPAFLIFLGVGFYLIKKIIQKIFGLKSSFLACLLMLILIPGLVYPSMQEEFLNKRINKDGVSIIELPKLIERDAENCVIIVAENSQFLDLFTNITTFKEQNFVLSYDIYKNRIDKVDVTKVNKLKKEYECVLFVPHIISPLYVGSRYEKVKNFIEKLNATVYTTYPSKLIQDGKVYNFTIYRI